MFFLEHYTLSSLVSGYMNTCIYETGIYAQLARIIRLSGCPSVCLSVSLSFRDVRFSMNKYGKNSVSINL